MRWTTIGLSAGSQLSAATQDPPAPEPQPRESQPIDWKKRIASLWIPAILGLGLMMAFAYLGVRIVAGKSQPGTPVVTKPAALMAPVVAERPSQPDLPLKAPPKPHHAALIATNFSVVTPQLGERYLQVAAVSPHMVLTYVDTLRLANVNVVVAPGPTPDLLRILVGPFADRDSLDQAKAELITAGRSPIARIY
jgi:hypothetical protein